MLTVWPGETKDSTLLTTKPIIPYHHAAVLSMSHLRSILIKESGKQSQYNDQTMGWTMTETQINSWQGQEAFLFPKNIKNNSGVQPTACSAGKAEFFSGCQAELFLQGYSGHNMKLTTLFHGVHRKNFIFHHLNQVNCLLPFLPSGHFPTSTFCMHF